MEPQRIDLDFLEWLGGISVPFSLIFTKTDKQSPTRTQANIDVFLEAVASRVPVVPEFFQSSAKTRTGREEILGAIGRYLESASS